MRVLAEKYGRLHVNVFHNRVQFFVRDGSRWLSIVYHYNLKAGDKTASKLPIDPKIVRQIFKRAFASKRFATERSRLFTDEVAAYLRSSWGVEIASTEQLAPVELRTRNKTQE